MKNSINSIKLVIVCLTLLSSTLIIPNHSNAQENIADRPWIKSKKQTKNEWKGYKIHEYKIDHFTIQVVEPQSPLKKKPWVMSIGEVGDGFHWEINEQILNSGAYIVAIDSYNTYGSDYGLALMDSLYAIAITQYDLPKKCTLFGVSRAGLSVYNWAHRYPNRVAAIYCEGPVMDFKTWPMSWEPSRSNWEELKNLYGFKSDTEAKAYKGNPIDNLEVVASHKIPIRHVISRTDEHDILIVPIDSNTIKAQRKLKALEHHLEVITIPEGMIPPYSFDRESVEFMISNALKANQ